MNLDKMQKIADDIAKKAPYLFAGDIDMSDKEKATILVQMQIHILSNADFHVESIATFEHSIGFVEGLVVGCAMAKLITKQEEDAFKKEILDKRNNFYRTDQSKQ